jgi:hypothetical protein
VQWSEDGDSFKIVDADKFEDEVLIPNFNNSCMLSFTRQLHASIFLFYTKLNSKLY